MINPVATSLITVLLVYLLSFWILPRESLWGNDSENKFLLMQSILDSGYSRYWIQWPGKAVAWLYTSNSLFSVTPFLLLAFIRPKDTETFEARRDHTRVIRDLALGYSFAYLMAAPSEMSFSGMHWGNRFLLVLYPLLTVLAATHIVRWAGSRGRRSVLVYGVAATLAVLSFGFQVVSLDMLRRKMLYTARLNEAVEREAGVPVVTTISWVPQELFRVFDDRLIFLISAPEQYEPLVKELARRGHESLLIITQTQQIPGTTPLTMVEDAGLNMFTVRLFRTSLDPRR